MGIYDKLLKLAVSEPENGEDIEVFDNPNEQQEIQEILSNLASISYKTGDQKNILKQKIINNCEVPRENIVKTAKLMGKKYYI